MTRIYVTRHGQNEDNAAGILNGHRDRPLTPLGLTQAQELSEEMQKAGLTFDAVYASPLCRAYKTAEVVTDALGLPKPEVMPELIERDFGILTGRPISDIFSVCPPQQLFKTSVITYFLEAEGAETFPQTLKRARRALAQVEATHPEESVLLVTHGDLGKMLYAAYYDLPWMEILAQFHFGNSELLLLAPDSPAHETHAIRIAQHNH